MFPGSGCCGFGAYGWNGWVLNLVIILIVIVGIIILAVWLVRQLSKNAANTTQSSSAVQSPREILQIRYARGEITREQYQEMLKDIN